MHGERHAGATSSNRYRRVTGNDRIVRIHFFQPRPNAAARHETIEHRGAYYGVDGEPARLSACARRLVQSHQSSGRRRARLPEISQDPAPREQSRKPPTVTSTTQNTRLGDDLMNEIIISEM